MGAPAFKNYLASIQALIGTHIDLVEPLERKISTLGTRVQDVIQRRTVAEQAGRQDRQP